MLSTLPLRCWGIPTVRPTVHTNPSQKRSHSKMLSKSKEVSSNTKLSQNDWRFSVSRIFFKFLVDENNSFVFRVKTNEKLLRCSVSRAKTAKFCSLRPRHAMRKSLWHFALTGCSNKSPHVTCENHCRYDRILSQRQNRASNLVAAAVQTRRLVAATFRRDLSHRVSRPL